MNKHGRPVGCHRIGGQREDAKRGRLHHDADDPEEHRGSRLQQVGKRLAGVPGQQGPTPNRIATKISASMSPLASASKIFSGMMPISWS